MRKELASRVDSDLLGWSSLQLSSCLMVQGDSKQARRYALDALDLDARRPLGLGHHGLNTKAAPTAMNAKPTATFHFSVSCK